MIVAEWNAGRNGEERDGTYDSFANVEVTSIERLFRHERSDNHS